jgi:glycine cleavage system regulatory protein
LETTHASQEATGPQPERGITTLSLVLTVLGDDKPGLVEALASTVTAHGGNWLESRMAHLAGKFAGILRVSVPEPNAETLLTALQGLAPYGLRVMAERSLADAPAQGYQWLRLNVVGRDRPGIVRDISQALAQRRINIDEFQTALTSAPMSGEALFTATAQLRVPASVIVTELQAHLEQLAHDLMVDVVLEDVPAGKEAPRVMQFSA